MTIETKFNPDDGVYLLNNNKVEWGKIASITWSLGGPFHYYLKPGGNWVSSSYGYLDTQLFRTKQELLDSL